MTSVHCSICWLREAWDSLPEAEQGSCRDRPPWLPSLRLWTHCPKHSIFRGDQDALLLNKQRLCDTLALT